MSNSLTTLGSVSTVFAQEPASSHDEFTAGVQGGFAVISYRGKVWRIKHQGSEAPVMRPGTSEPSGTLEIVLVKGAPHIAKIFYDRPYQEGDMEAPDCFSVNGVTPDPASPRKQSPTCAACKNNVWGSKVTAQGKPTKACQDSRRIAVVALGDMASERYGGPLLLRIPPASLGELAAYANKMKTLGYQLHQIATRVGFDLNAAYPRFAFQAIRVLDDAEARTVTELRYDERTNVILATATEAVQHDPSATSTQEQLASQAFEQPPVQAPRSNGPVNVQVDAEYTVHDDPRQTEMVMPAAPPAGSQVATRMAQLQQEMDALKTNGAGVPATVTVTELIAQTNGATAITKARGRGAAASKPAVEDKQPAPSATPAPEDLDNILDTLLG